MHCISLSFLSLFFSHSLVPVGVQPPVVTVAGSTSFQFNVIPPTQPNGIITLYRIFVGNDVVLSFPPSQETIIASSLSPFTNYTIQLEACTAIGCTNSSSDTAMTLSSAPTGLTEPSLTALSPTSIEATWEPPLYPNGVILYYTLVQTSDNSVLFNGTDTRATLTGLSPNTVYSYRVTAHNIAGSVSSNESSVLTLEDVPDQILPPNVSVVSARSLNVSWQEPLQPNGNILNYTLLLDSDPVFSGLQLQYTLNDLQPFTQYEISIQACTTKGCSESSRVYQTTPEAPPEGFNPPTITSITSDSVTVVISEVSTPNGLVYYSLNVTGEFRLGSMERQSSYETRLVFNSTMIGEGVVVSSLLPFTEYELVVVVGNVAGSLIGDTVNVTTDSAGQ